MSTSDTRKILGLGAIACIACCIGPILGVLGAIGLATIGGVALFGAAGLAVALIVLPVLRRARHRPGACMPNTDPVAVDAPTARRVVASPSTGGADEHSITP